MAMKNSDLYFHVGSEIKVEGNPFVVEGYIVFKQYDGSSWTEYMLRSKGNYEVKWLSVDIEYDEYAIYTQCGYGEDFSAKSIIDNGYKKVDDEIAKVLDYKGQVDVELGEQVSYRDYEDNTEELLISIEEWDGEKEYSRGYYIDKEDIEKINTPNNALHIGAEDYSSAANIRKIIIAFIFIVLIVIVILKMGLLNFSKKEILSKYINSNSSFEYVTSITSDLDENKKANVYSTNKTVEDTAKLLIDGVQGNIDDVQESQQDGTVVITTKDELALIYISEDAKTLVQVSLREYVYSSRHMPYRGSNITDGYYRRYYYTTVYQKDKTKFKKLPNAYRDYNGGQIVPDDNNKYRIYSSSVRQSSVNSRTSSGGGTSFGK